MFKGWKTIGFNTALFLVSAVEAADPNVLFGPFAGYAGMGIAVVGLVLRTLTTGAVGEKK